MKKFELWLYGIGTVSIVKAVFGIGLPKGLLIALAGVGCLVAAYYLGKHTRRF